MLVVLTQSLGVLRLATPLRSPSPTFIGEDCPVNPDLSSGLSAGERTAPLTSLEHHACLLHIAGPGTLFMRELAMRAKGRVNFHDSLAARRALSSRLNRPRRHTTRRTPGTSTHFRGRHAARRCARCPHAGGTHQHDADDRAPCSGGCAAFCVSARTSGGLASPHASVLHQALVPRQRFIE